jgi:pimeloyl-ACP methyl ester carboxylesterase
VFKWSDTPIEPRFCTIDGVTIRFAESPARDADALLLSPWPESLLAFEQVWPRLAGRAHLVAIDPPGFGHSQRHDGLLSPRAMGEFIVRAADWFGLRNPHAVGPGTGTPALLFAAAAHPGRLRSIVVGSGAAAVPLRLGSYLREWAEAADPSRYRDADPRDLVSAALRELGRYVLPDHVREDYLSCCYGDRLASSMRYVRAYTAELPALRDLLPEIGTPVEIITGTQDAVVPPANAEFLHERLPHSRLDILDAGHFVWEEAPSEYAAIVTRWWDGGYAS